MPSAIDARLAALGITLPEAAAPLASYVPFVVTGSLVFVSGQISRGPDGPIRGKLGADMDAAAGAAAARACGLALIAQLRTVCGGDLDRVRRVVKLTGFVNATPEFTEHPQVINGASELMLEVFGEAGRHARAAVGSASLPLGVAVEVEGVFEIA
jgi:enamine deaminase RidA (YjgF/YER057c/UK114 family)